MRRQLEVFRGAGHSSLITLYAILLVYLLAVTASAERSVYVSHVDGEFYYPVLGAETDGKCLRVDQPTAFHIHITNTDNPECFFLPSMGFEINDNGTGGSWTWPSTDPAECLTGDEPIRVDSAWHDIPGLGIVIVVDSTLFDDTTGGIAYGAPFDCIYRDFSSGDGVGADIIGFAGVISNPPGLYYGLDKDVLKLKLTPHDVGSIICLDITDVFSGYEWGWSPLAVDYDAAPCNVGDQIPTWGGPYCYTIAPCCGMHAMGLTGNTNCSGDGEMTLADIAKLIDRVYLSKQPLCCEASGNTDGSEDGLMTLADVTRLIDRVYISKSPTAVCQ